jgi:hypothetical protein
LKKSETYSAKVKESLKIFIFNEEDTERKLSPDQYKIVMKNLLDLWDKQPPGESRPAFSGHGINNHGLAWISCANELSRSWVIKAVEEVDKLIDGVMLSANPEDKLTKMIVVIPSDPDETFPTITTVLKRLTEGPNLGLNTNKWTVYSTKDPGPRGWCLFLGIDDDSLNILRNLDFRPYYGFGRLYFNVQNTKPKVN